LLVGACTGALAALLLELLNGMNHWLWDSPRPLLPLVIGLLIGLLHRRGTSLPELSETMAQLHQPTGLPLAGSTSHLLLGMLALLGGGPLGPEALLGRGAAVAAAALSRLWQRFPGFFTGLGGWATSGAMAFLGSPWVGVAALLRGSRADEPGLIWRLLPGLTSGLGGFVAFRGMQQLVGGEQAVPYLWPHSETELWHRLLQVLLLAPLVGGLGGLLGLGFVQIRSLLATGLQRLSPAMLPRSLFTGAVLCLVGLFQPLALFSGEDQLTSLLSGQLLDGSGPLLVLGLSRIGLCALCLASGWVGGLFYPLVMAACAIAVGLVQACPWLPLQLAVSALACGVQTGVLGQPLLPVLVTLAVLRGHGPGAVLMGGLGGWLVHHWLRQMAPAQP
jgi:hypothetical protein